MTQRNWLRTNDIDPEQDFADLCREYDILDNEAELAAVSRVSEIPAEKYYSDERA